MKPAAPTGGKPRKEPGLLLPRPKARALLLTCVTLTGPLELDIPHQVSTKRRAPSLLDVQEHDDIIPLDVEINSSAQICSGEVETRNEAGQGAILCDVRIFLKPVLDWTVTGPGARCTADSKPGAQVVQHPALGLAGTHILDHNHAKDQHHEQDDNESLVAAVGLLIHVHGADRR